VEHKHWEGLRNEPAAERWDVETRIHCKDRYLTDKTPAQAFVGHIPHCSVMHLVVHLLGWCQPRVFGSKEKEADWKAKMSR
jgi:hypothetical protein